jgi:plasmid maintenance system antidote protein VapI
MKARNKTNKLPKELELNQIWDGDKLNKLSQFIVSESQKQSKERRLRNELLSIQFQIEDYIEKDKIERSMRILDFVKLYLKALKISQKELANIFEMRDTNLYKYLVGDRKLNNDLVLKLSSFSHTQPEVWYYVQTKNDLYELKKEKDKIKKYEKYDYQKTVSIKDA